MREGGKMMRGREVEEGMYRMDEMDAQAVNVAPFQIIDCVDDQC